MAGHGIRRFEIQQTRSSAELKESGEPPKSCSERSIPQLPIWTIPLTHQPAEGHSWLRFQGIVESRFVTAPGKKRRLMLASISQALSFLREALQRTSGLCLAEVCTSNSLCCIESDFRHAWL